MPDIDEINGLVLCDETNVNGVVIANISQIDGLSKKCVICNTIDLGESTRDCATACREDCTTHYTSKDLTIAPLGVGDYIFRNSSCVCENVFNYLYYSDQCGGEGNCYEISSETCQILNVASCE